jgi:hypothetical protein
MARGHLKGIKRLGTMPRDSHSFSAWVRLFAAAVALGDFE